MIENKTIDIPAPFKRSDYEVKSEWIDHNGHMNVTYYLEAFDQNIGDFFRSLGLTKEYRLRESVATYCGDFHIHYIRELFEKTRIEISEIPFFPLWISCESFPSTHMQRQQNVPVGARQTYLHANRFLKGGGRLHARAWVRSDWQNEWGRVASRRLGSVKTSPSTRVER